MSLCCVGNIGFRESFVRSIRSAFCCESSDSCCELTSRVTLAVLTSLGVGFIWHIGVGFSNTCLSVNRSIVLIPQEYEFDGSYDVRRHGGGLFLYRDNVKSERTDGFAISLTTHRGGFFSIGNSSPDGYRGDLICTDLYEKILFRDALQAEAFLKHEPLVWECPLSKIGRAPCFELAKKGDFFIQWPGSEGYPAGRILRKQHESPFPEIVTIEDLQREYSESSSPVLKVFIDLWFKKSSS